MVIAASPIAGWLSDRHGRRPVLTALAVGFACLSIGLFAILAHAQVILVLIAALLAVIAGGLTAVAASAIPEQFRTASRFTGLAIGGTVATTGWVIALGILIASVALATIPAIRRSPETAARHQTHS